MAYEAIENFDPARIPNQDSEASFHDDATYVFAHLAAAVIPQFNQNLAWIDGALTGDTESILDSLNAVLAATAVEIGAKEIVWGNGEHRLTSNDGGGNACVRFGHYHDGGVKVSQAGGSGVLLQAQVDNAASRFTIDLFGSGAAAGDVISSVKKLVLAADGEFTWGGNQIWHAGNGGSGSDLDAGKLEGHRADYFAPIDNPSFTGTPELGDAEARTIQFTNLEPSSFSSDGQFGFDASRGAVVYRGQQPGDATGDGVYTILDTANVAAGANIEIANLAPGVSGSEPITFSVTQGGGSGLDADKLDGKHASAFVTDFRLTGLAFYDLFPSTTNYAFGDGRVISRLSTSGTAINGVYHSQMQIKKGGVWVDVTGG